MTAEKIENPKRGVAALITPTVESVTPLQTAVPGVTPLAVDLIEAAQMLGVCEATVRREIQRGKLRGFKIGRVFRVRIAELHAYLKRLEDSER